MPKVCRSLFVFTVVVLLTASLASAQSQAQPSRAELTARIQDLQKQLSELEAAVGAAPAQVAVAQAAGQRGQAPAPAPQGGQRGQAPAQGGRGAQTPPPPA